MKIQKRECLVLGTIILVGLVYLVHQKMKQHPEYFEAPMEQSNRVAKKLNEKGWKMYGTDSCGFCRKQKKLFGRSFIDIQYIQCDKSGKCDQLGIVGYPTWHNGSNSSSGYKSLEELELMADSS